MKKIEVKVIASPIKPIEMTNLAAKLTQHSVTSMQDLMNIYNAKPSEKLVTNIQHMRHESVTRHGDYTVAIVGASRRFLAQFRTHHVGIDFTSGSLQYQDMCDSFDMVVPYDVYRLCKEQGDTIPLIWYKASCKTSFASYKEAISLGLSNDTAGYISCQASRNVLLITGNAEAWRNVINKRTCNRNTEETQYVSLLIWKALLETPGGKVMFGSAGPNCIFDKCIEGHMCCQSPIMYVDPQCIIDSKFPLLKEDF